MIPNSDASTRAYGVHSEVGKLRKVLVCAPGLAHQRLTPTNCDELLFDDVLWVQWPGLRLRCCCRRHCCPDSSTHDHRKAPRGLKLDRGCPVHINRPSCCLRFDRQARRSRILCVLSCGKY